MNFELNEEQTLIRNMVREFVDSDIKPIAAIIDKQHRFPQESIAPMAELGLFGFNINEAFGGSDADAVSYILATEEMAKVSAAHAMIMGSQCSLTGPIIQKYADAQTQQRLLPKVVTGESLGCFCLSEPSAGCDAAAQQTTAMHQGDSYIINGSKLWITAAPQHRSTAAPQGAFFIVFAMTDKSQGVKGITAFLVERDNPGISIGLPEEKMGMNGSDTCAVSFSDCVVPARCRLGAEGKDLLSPWKRWMAVGSVARRLHWALPKVHSMPRSRTPKNVFSSANRLPPIKGYSGCWWRWLPGLIVPACWSIVPPPPKWPDTPTPAKPHKPSFMLLKPPPMSLKKQCNCMVAWATPRLTRLND